jgi:hypothetical protein
MKARRIEYLDGEFEFEIPADWAYEFDPESGGVAYHPEDEVAGCLEISMITAQMGLDAEPGSPLDDVKVGADDGEPVRAPCVLASGNALSVSRSEFDDADGEAWVSHTFVLANRPAARWKRIAILTFSAPPGQGQAALEFFLDRLPDIRFGELGDDDAEWVDDEIDADGKTVPYRQKTLDDVPEVESRALTAAETHWIVAQAALAAEIVHKRAGSGRAASAEERLEHLDQAFAAWLSAARKGREPAARIAESFGAAFGEICREELGLSWRHITDQWGATFAVCASAGNYTLYPISSVEKRIEDGQTGFFLNIFLMARRQLAEIGVH